MSWWTCDLILLFHYIYIYIGYRVRVTKHRQRSCSSGCGAIGTILRRSWRSHWPSPSLASPRSAPGTASPSVMRSSAWFTEVSMVMLGTEGPWEEGWCGSSWPTGWSRTMMGTRLCCRRMHQRRQWWADSQMPCLCWRARCHEIMVHAIAWWSRCNDSRMKDEGGLYFWYISSLMYRSSRVLN